MVFFFLFQLVSPKDLKNEMEYMTIEKKQSKKKERDNNAGMMGDFMSGDLDGSIQKTTDTPFEHRHTQQSEYSSSDKETSKSKKILLVKYDSYEKDDAKYGLTLNTNEERISSKMEKAFIHHPEIFVPGLTSDNLDLPKKMDQENSEKTEECLAKKKEEKKSNNIATAKNIFQKFIKWSLDEHFCTGVMQSGSYIDQLSKALTG